MSLMIDYCSHKAARYAVEHWHYSGSMPTPPIVKIGVWENGKFVGSVLFSRGANDDLGSPYGLEMTEVCELTRVALSNHINPVSLIISRAIIILKDKEKGLRLIVSFADPNQKHLGIIYQATNWIYTGTTPKDYKYRSPDGRVWHSRQVTKTGITRQYGETRTGWKRDDCEKIPQLGKHRYLYPLDKGMRRQILPLAQPYPKCGQGVNGDTPTLQVGEAGSIPAVRSDMTSGEPELVE